MEVGGDGETKKLVRLITSVVVVDDDVVDVVESTRVMFLKDPCKGVDSMIWFGEKRKKVKIDEEY